MDIVRETGIPTECLKPEITESAVMEDAVSGKKMLDDIKAPGVLQCLDDFGTAYSSLSCLHEFPIDVLKIDKSPEKNPGLRVRQGHGGVSHRRGPAALLTPGARRRRTRHFQFLCE